MGNGSMSWATYSLGALARSLLHDICDLLYHLPMQSRRFVDRGVGQVPIRGEINIGEFALKARTRA